jgi:hypothetical protein
VPASRALTSALIAAVTSTRTPFGISLAGGAVTVVAAALAAAAVTPAHATGARLLVVAIAVCGYSSAVRDAQASFAVAGLAYLLFTGFLLNRYGDLTWDGTTSVWHLVAFSGAMGLGLGLRWIRTRRADMAVDIELKELIEEETNGA